MNRKMLFTALLFCVVLPVFRQGLVTDFTGQSGEQRIIHGDFVLQGTVLIQYQGWAENVIIPAYLGITEIADDAFRGRDIRTITIPSSVTSIGDWAFTDCTSLTSITIPSGVNSIGKCAFAGCDSLTSITVDIQNSMYSSLNGVLFNKNRTVLFAYPASKQERTYAIPAGVAYIEDYAFTSCNSLTSVTLPASVTSIEDRAFFYCGSLTGITIPASVTVIGMEVFAGCSSLNSITVDSRNSEYSSVEGVLFNKNKTVLIAYPSGKQGSYTIPAGVTEIWLGAFTLCNGLTNVTIPASVTVIESYAFYYCRNLISITIPSSVTAIGSFAFSNCTSLTSVTIPSSVTFLGSGAFYGCSSLASVTISRRTRIGTDVFPSSARITYSD